MRIVGSICFIIIQLGTFVLGQQSTTSGGKTSAKVPAKTVTGTSSEQRISGGANIEQAIARSKTRIALQRSCDSLYGNEIQTKTGDLHKKLMDMVQQERVTESKKYETNANLRKMRESNKRLRVKDSLAFSDTSANRLQLRNDARNERLTVMKKMRAEEAKAQNDPELLKIRQSMAALRKQIDDSIAVIIKDDQKCRECYISSNK